MVIFYSRGVYFIKEATQKKQIYGINMKGCITKVASNSPVLI